MAVERSFTPSPRTVYRILILLGLLAAFISSVGIGIICYNYVTREELRNPPHKEETHEETHAGLPPLTLTPS